MGTETATLATSLPPAVIAEAQAGDPAAFEAIFEAYYPRIVSYCFRLVGDAEQAQDLAQDTFVKAYHALPRTGAGLNLQAWLFTIATNTALSALRRRRRIAWLPLLDRHPAPDRGYGSVEQVGDRELLQAALDRLPRESAALILLRLHYGLSYEELAPLFGGSVGAVKTRLSRARRAFRDAYAAVGGRVDDGKRET